MKYLKLFEQFEDEEDSWWDEESKFDSIKDLKIVMYCGNYYIVEMSSIIGLSPTEWRGTKSILFYNKETNAQIIINNPTFGDNNLINIYDSENKYGIDRSGNLRGWKIFKYKDLPKEIKDRLI